MKILFSSNIAWSIYNFRTKLLKQLQRNGHNVYAVAKADLYVKNLEAEGFIFKNIDINNNSTNPLEDLKLVWKYIKLYKEIAPDIILHNAIKPNIYGTIAAKYLGIPVINNISGLGTLFIKKSISTVIAKQLYKFSQYKADKVFFQNSDDLNLFINNGLVKKEVTQLIPGSGVDTNYFVPKVNKRRNTPFKFLFVARLIADKGIREYIDAIKILKKKYNDIEFTILGSIYQANATSITHEELQNWVSNLGIIHIPHSDHVKEIMQEVDCLVLPSYREGLSKVLIEASSLAIPIITTDVPGCRDVVIDGYNGFLCKVSDANDLAKKMEKTYSLHDNELFILGANARKRAVEVFDIEIINDIYEDAINNILNIKN
nr:glycosyltransferase family 4 protein [uncultured Flavobacterium sp.]